MNLLGSESVGTCATRKKEVISWFSNVWLYSYRVYVYIYIYVSKFVFVLLEISGIWWISPLTGEVSVTASQSQLSAGVARPPQGAGHLHWGVILGSP